MGSDFEIIDKRHIDITKYKNGGERKFITMGGCNTIYISNGAVLYWDILKNKYIHFINKKGKLYFYCDNDIDNGFSLCKARTDLKECAHKVSSKRLCVVLKKTFGIERGMKFNLVESTLEYEEKTLIQVMINNPIKKAKK